MSETRRSFLESTLATAALAGMAGPAEAQSRANVTIGIIGAGIRGLELMGVALEAGAKVAMVCDLYDGHFRRAQELQKNTPTTRDFHEVLARPDIQAVLVATSDHWHAPVAIAAMRAGKDVYCEKPMAHTIARGAGNGRGIARNRAAGTGGQPDR